MLMDEFYSHYMYEADTSSGRPFHTLSSAEFVDDVNKDPICIVNGFTKNWRLPFASRVRITPSVRSTPSTRSSRAGVGVAVGS